MPPKRESLMFETYYTALHILIAPAWLLLAIAPGWVWTRRIVKRCDTTKGFKLLPRRWVLERTFAWLGRCRRLAKDFEASIASVTAWCLIAHIRLLTRRLARYYQYG